MTFFLAPVGGGFEALHPRIESLEISHTTESSVLLKVNVNFTNPTAYSAKIPLTDLSVLSNGTAVGHVTGRDLVVKPGVNTGVSLDVSWNPLESGGKEGVIAGQDLVSAYVSGLLNPRSLAYANLTSLRNEPCRNLQNQQEHNPRATEAW